MSRLVSSDNALRALLLLSQRGGGMRTSEVAAALEISYTGAEKAIDILVADGLAEASGRRYALAPAPRAREAVRFALAFLPAEVTLGALARGNEAVEFGGASKACARSSPRTTTTWMSKSWRVSFETIFRAFERRYARL